MNKADEVFSITVKVTRRGRSTEFTPPLHSSGTAVRFLRGRWTSRQAVLVIRVEGPLQEVRETLHAWEVRPGTAIQPLPLSPVVGAPPGAPAAFEFKRLNPSHGTALLKTSRRSDGPDPAFRESCVFQEIDS